MRFQKSEPNSFCVDQQHYSGTKNIVGEITFNKETGREINKIVEQCWICNRKKSMIDSDNTIQAKGLGDFFKKLGKKGLNVSKTMAKNVLKNPGRALEIGANVGSEFASRSPKTGVSSLPELINFYHSIEVYTLVFLVIFVPSEWNKNVIEYTQVHY